MVHNCLAIEQMSILGLFVVEDFKLIPESTGVRVSVVVRDVSPSRGRIAVSEKSRSLYGEVLGVTKAWLDDYLVRQPHRDSDTIERELKHLGGIGLMKPPIDPFESFFVLLRDDASLKMSFRSVLRDDEFDSWLAHNLADYGDQHDDFKHSYSLKKRSDVYSNLFVLPDDSEVELFLRNLQSNR